MDLVTKDQDVRRNIVNLVSEGMASRIKDIPEEYWSLSEVELLELTPRQKWSPIERQLRHKFWDEYDRAVDAHEPLNINRIMRGVCTSSHFYERITRHPAKLSYILLPPTDQQVRNKELLDLGSEKFREIFEMPICETVDGRKIWYPKNADIIVKAWKMLDERVNGAVIQTSKNLNINAEVMPEKKSEPLNMDEVERKLRELEKENIQDAIVVESEDGLC